MEEIYEKISNDIQSIAKEMVVKDKGLMSYHKFDTKEGREKLFSTIRDIVRQIQPKTEITNAEKTADSL